MVPRSFYLAYLAYCEHANSPVVISTVLQCIQDDFHFNVLFFFFLTSLQWLSSTHEKRKDYGANNNQPNVQIRISSEPCVDESNELNLQILRQVSPLFLSAQANEVTLVLSLFLHFALVNPSQVILPIVCILRSQHFLISTFALN